MAITTRWSSILLLVAWLPMSVAQTLDASLNEEVVMLKIGSGLSAAEHRQLITLLQQVSTNLGDPP